jgi:dTDP-4-dehydrorhamnose 3,5-epimerase
MNHAASASLAGAPDPATEIALMPTPLPGVLLLQAPRFEDERGWFAELWNTERYRTAGLDVSFAQSNVSRTRRGVLRGLHFQHPNGQGKLITVLGGAVYDAVVDVRTGSPTFGRWFGCELSAENRRQLWVPAGFAHGFLALTEDAVVHYNCTAVYDAGSEHVLAWDDADVGIAWPGSPALVSSKDGAAPWLDVLVRQPSVLPRYPTP